jgi:hypothetical protein
MKIKRDCESILWRMGKYYDFKLNMVKKIGERGEKYGNKFVF